MDAKESRPKAAGYSHVNHTAPAHRLRRRLAHCLYPWCVFNADMSAEIDRLTADVERMRSEQAACVAGGAR